MKKAKREPDIYDDLYQAVARYVAAKGGKVLVAGGVQVAEYGEFRFDIRIKCTGKPPQVAASSADEVQR